MLKRIYYLCCFVYSCFPIAHTNAQMITTIAGNNTVGYSGDGGPAINAILNGPQYITSDSTGNLYFADFYNNCIRKISTTGSIMTVAGNNAAGYSGDGGPADLAKLNQPQSVAVDRFNNLYIVDSKNHCIRRVDFATGVISTFAGKGISGNTGDGGPATSCTFRSPFGVATDYMNNVYITDVGNSNIRKVDATGIITTFAGNSLPGFSGDGGLATNATLRSPCGIITDNFGNIYFADGGNHCIRMIDTSGKINSIVGNHFGAGTGTGGYSGDNGPATAAKLNFPEFLTIDYSGNMYISDYQNHRVRKVDAATRIITTIAGDGIPGYNGDGVNATAAELFFPAGVVLDGTGGIYIADRGNNRIRFVASTLFADQADNYLPEISISPNPTIGGHFIVNISSRIQEKIVLSITNSSGLRVKSVSGQTNHPLSIQLTDPNGTYFLNVMVKGRAIHSKIIIQ